MSAVKNVQFDLKNNNADTVSRWDTTISYRDNFDADHSIYDLFMQWAVTPEFNLQAEIRNRKTDLGDLNFNFDPDIFRPNLRTSLDETTARFGARYSPDPNNDTLFSFVYSDRDETFSNTFQNFGFDFDRDENRAFLTHDRLDAGYEIFQVVEVVGRRISGALCHACIVDPLRIRYRLTAGRSVNLVV